MQTFCGAFPILPGRTEAGRQFAKAVMGPRRKEYEESLHRQGVSRESWFLQSTPLGDLMIVYFEAADLAKALEAVGKSKDPFGVWFREQVKSVTGVDLAQPQEGPPPEEIVHV